MSASDDDTYGFVTSMREGSDAQRAYEQDRRVRAVFAEIERTLCELCDSAGYRPNRIVCDHVDRTEVARRGMALIRDVLRAAELKKQANRGPNIESAPSQSEESG
jgi:hypothetical protein